MSNKGGKMKTVVKPILCVFVSIWDDDVTLRSKALYHPDTGEVEALEIHDVDGLESLEREFIIIKEGTDQEEELEVCTDCHEYVLKTVMVPGAARHSLEETQVCSDSDCDSNQEVA